MRRYFQIIAAGFIVVSLASCSKNDDNGGGSAGNLNEMEAAVASDFGSNIALASYTDLSAAATTLNTSVNTFVTTPTNENLQTCKQAWISLRQIWEGSEGYLFGPVEDNEYDPKMDTWPTDYTQMNVLLNDSANHPLDLTDIESLDYSLRGYHPMEYMLWGVNSNKQASEFTSRQVKYLLSLSLDVQTLCGSLNSEWTGGFTNQVVTAGKGSTSFPTYYSLLNTLNEGMIGICNEVGKSDENTGKIYEPFIQKDSNVVESPYSENSMTDFKNNIQGAYNVYLGKYKTQGTGITNIVASLNKNLDNEIRQKFENAINAFGTVNGSFELAIFNQRTQLQSLMDAIGAVRDALQNDLSPFLLAQIKN